MMYLSILVSLAMGANRFEFGGGSIPELALALAAESQKSVVALVDPARQMPTMSIEFEMREDLFRKVQASASLLPLQGDVLVLPPEAWPNMVMRPENRTLYYQRIAVGAPVFEFTPSKGVTLLAPKDRVISMKELPGLAWSKQLSIHWFHQRFAIWPNITNVPEVVALRAIAKCVGGKFTIKSPTKQFPKGQYVIDFDPRQHRNRMVKLASDRSSAGSVLLMREFMILALEEVSDQRLIEAFAKVPGGRTVTIDEMPKTVDHIVALAKRFATELNQATDPGAVMEQHRRTEWYGWIDHDIPPDIVFGSEDSTVSAVFRGKKYKQIWWGG